MNNDLYWIKFYDEGDIECLCPTCKKQCPIEVRPKCKEYIIKFIEVERVIPEPLPKELNKRLLKELKTKKDELQRVFKKFKI